MIPEWMKDTRSGPFSPSANVKPKKKSDFVKKTIGGVLGFFQDTIEADDISHRDGVLQGLDPRVKLISALAIVVATTMVRDLKVLIFIYALTLFFAIISKIEVSFFIKRVWLFIPIFTGVIVLPMIFNVFAPGDPLFTVMTLGAGAHLGPFHLPQTIYVTVQGAMSAAVFTLRVAACVSLVVLLFLTTPREVLFRSLRSLGVPKVYVLTLDMCYRYIFLFMDMVRDLYTARKSRMIKSSGMLADQKWVGGRMGYTLVKSLDMSQKVHGAMISRGFNGDVKILEDHKMAPKDYLAGITAFAISVMLVLYTYKIIL
jgi:cobalt/nickel transport system permease protein